MRVLLGIIIAFIILFIAARLYTTFGVPAPRNLGMRDSHLSPCPDTPNCVSTRAPTIDAEHFMPSIPYTSDASFVMTQILRAVSVQPRAKVIKQDDTYLHVEFRSRIMGFPDDVEFYIDDANKRIHFRSAARLGQGDMGVNRKRMTDITEAIKATL
jgi:uncharacterized protein (DUF1499 family)